MLSLQPIPKQKTPVLIPIASCLLLAACGGGSSDSDNSSGGTGNTPPTNYTVTATAGAGGSISPASRSVQSGQSTTFTVNANEGYSIDTVTGCGGSLSGSTFTTGAINSACSITASFNAVLGAPESLQVIAGDSKLTLNWQGVTESDSYILYYDIEPNIDPENYASTHTGHRVQDVSSPFILDGLSNGTTYYAVVTAIYEGQESTASNEVSGTPQSVVASTTVKLNDTGIDWCANDTTTRLDCPAAGFEGQDGEYGRDALARAGQLTKLGDGPAGFDFTKLDAHGNDLPASAVEWSCVRDNHTGLIWEVKTNSRKYTWFSPNNNTNGGESGTEGFNVYQQDTYQYVNEVNGNGLCGASDWRMPTRKELLGIVHNGAFPAIAGEYFPLHQNNPSWSNVTYWTSSPYAIGSNRAWTVNFNHGDLHWELKSSIHHVRLVREND